MVDKSGSSRESHRPENAQTEQKTVQLLDVTRYLQTGSADFCASLPPPPWQVFDF